METEVLKIAGDVITNLNKKRNAIVSLITLQVFNQRIKTYIDLIEAEMKSSGNDNPFKALIEISEMPIYENLDVISQAMLQCATLEIIENRSK